MSEVKAVGATSSQSSRVGKELALGIVRFRDNEDRPLWRLRVTRLCNGDALIEEDATIQMLMAMESFVQRAIEAVRTDGGRKQ